MELNQLIDTYGERLYNLAARITGDREEAHDVVQDTLLTFIEKKDSLRGESSAYTWLYRVAVNRSLQFNRIPPPEIFEQQRDLLDYKDTSLPEELQEWENNPEKRLFLKELMADIRSECHQFMLFILTPEQRITFLLRTIAHLSYKEIGDVLSIEENTVKGRMDRIKKRIEKDFNQRCGHINPEGECQCRGTLKYVLKSYPQILNKISGNTHFIGEVEEAFKNAGKIELLYKKLPSIKIDRDIIKASLKSATNKN